MGTSGAAASAERDPDSLEREDDSLFPACLLELFLSHISPAKSPLFFFLGLFLTHSLIHDLSSPPSESTVVRSAAPLIHRKPVKCPCQQQGVFCLSCDCHCAGDQVQKSASTSREPSNQQQCSRYTHRSIGPLLWFVSIFILYTKYSLPFPPMSNTRKHTHTEAIY